MNHLRILLSASLCALCAAPIAFAATNELTEPFQGVRLIHSKTTVPRQMDIYVVEIDMSATGLEFLATPSNGALVGDTTPQTTRAFVTEAGAQIGINASFFSSAGGGQYNVLGLGVSNGDAYSPFQPDFIDALNVSASNVATIIRATGTSGFAHQPPSSLYNAVAGNVRLVSGGNNVANPANLDIHPRSAAGVTADQKLLLLTVDGRNVGHSEGLTLHELADLLVRWGARDAINLDGGGSTTLVLDNPLTASHDPQVMNIPSDLLPNGQRGKERAVANSLAVFASPHTQPTDNVFVFADFESGDEGAFGAALAFSGSNRGFDSVQSSAEAVATDAFDGLWSQRLTIIDDPNSDGDTQHPDGAWFARHVAGFGNPGNNIRRPAEGYVGLWGKTSDPDLKISLVLDDASLATGERGIAQDMIADGQWRLYEWNLDDPNQWEGWVNGDGMVNDSFTLDSIQIFGPPDTASDRDAVIHIDNIFHRAPNPLGPILPGDYNADGIVDAADYTTWQDSLGETVIRGSGADGDESGTIDAGDYDVWKANFGSSVASGSEIPGSARGSPVPEPQMGSLLLVLTTIAGGCRVFRRTGEL